MLAAVPDCERISEGLLAQLPQARWLRLEGAGHAPFLSHVTLLADAVCAGVPGVPSPATLARPGATEAL